MNNVAEHQDSDPVSIGIREWQKVKQAAEEAVEEAKKAQEEASYFRGQCELMQQQRQTDEANLRRLQQHCDEMNIMVESLGAAVLSIVEKRKAGFFRRAGSNNGVERIRPVPTRQTPTDLDESMREITRGLVRPVTDTREQPAR